MRKILNFSELSEQEKKQRYKVMYTIPSLAILMLLLSADFNYIFMSFIVVAFILIELIIFGLMDSKYDYSLSGFLKDSLYLMLSSFVVTYIAVPLIFSVVTKNMNLSDTILNGLNFSVSMFLLYGSWFTIVALQSKVKKKTERWKWEITRIFYDNKKFDKTQ